MSLNDSNIIDSFPSKHLEAFWDTCSQKTKIQTIQVETGFEELTFSFQRIDSGTRRWSCRLIRDKNYMQGC
jgi:hypothetical protein